MSTFRCEVVPVKLENHPNADSLSVVQVFDNYTVVVRTEDWKGRNLGVYIPPDSVVPDTEEWSFLEGHRRIKARKFRGIMSQGFLAPLPDNGKEHKIGDDLAEEMGIQHYQPILASDIKQGLTSNDPPFPGEKYDIEGWFKYSKVLEPGEMVAITEKLHGTNARFSYQDGKFWAGSRKHFRKEDDDNIYWRVLKENHWLQSLCRLYPDHIIYGEIYGWVQKLRYGAKKPGELWFRFFDILKPDGQYLEATPEFLMDPYLLVQPNGKVLPMGNHVPVLYVGPYSPEKVIEFMDGQTTIPGASHIREGCVVKPIKERYHRNLGRVILKAVSPTYLSKAKD